jgi:ketosteroid isomerase-like protein
MSQQNVEFARRGYAALNETYRNGDVNALLPIAEEMWDPEIVLRTTGAWPESGEWHGHDGVLEFTRDQMEALNSMWIEPEEFIDAGDKVVVFVRFGGQARHTGIDAEFSVAHVWTLREGKALRVDMFERKSQALRAAGLSE